MRAFLVLSLLTLSGSLFAQQPEPHLEPAQAVQLQLNALKQGAEADLAVVFRFASPRNRAQTGPAARFAQMIRKAYPELLQYRSVSLVPAVVDGNEAVQGLELIARDGRAYEYVFLLSRQDGPDCRGCWMTDAVIGKPAKFGQSGV